ncbi:hypothetical protein B5F07_03230 [Lachnoclostridium sp. An169]|nr:hypothetical protein B5F07_03230 [Lachnoclostridium sp. An169]
MSGYGRMREARKTPGKMRTEKRGCKSVDGKTRTEKCGQKSADRKARTEENERRMRRNEKG